MKNHILNKTKWSIAVLLFFAMNSTFAQSETSNAIFESHDVGLYLILLLVAVPLTLFFIYSTIKITNQGKNLGKHIVKDLPADYLKDLELEQVRLLRVKKESGSTYSKITSVLLTISTYFVLQAIPAVSFGQSDVKPATRDTIMSQPGVIITLVLLFIPLMVAFILLVTKINRMLANMRKKKLMQEAEELAILLENTEGIASLEDLNQKEQALSFSLENNELSGIETPSDKKGLLKNVKNEHDMNFFAQKNKPMPRPKIDPNLTKLILAFIGSAIFWLVLGTSIGEYVGIKFIAPDADSVSWLSFGRLRPVHTNLVFWGWASLGMLGLGYYVVPMVGNGPLASLKMGWYSLFFINLSHVLGTISLMAGVNNGGGEYREYIWPIMSLFAAGLVLSMTNYLKTIALRKTKEIYISNWYITSAVIFLPIIAVVSYLPFWQKGIGETILQGFYMHQAVGLWFMFFCLGLLYYFLPQQLNKPIFSYSLGVLAFWTQILFYTLIGTHHFVFSALPWWLQTVAIVGSVGMLIPVTSGTINFLMTFKGSWNKVSNSYSLPFFVVGIIYYFTGSFQGTAEAFRSTNLIWHFTDFTIAHSHITMYGIITFIIFAGIYAIVPRLTGQEPPQLMVGAHFWFALIGLQFYTIPLMIGGTFKGLSWAEGKPFIDSVVLMAPYWLWRAIGGSMMWISHLILAYNFYKMMFATKELDVKEEAFKILQQKVNLSQN
jgi:cytochrome c oxidase cbb3-type subunit 1